MVSLNETLKKAYAKTTGESIREHTDQLLKRLDVIKKMRGDKILEACPEPWREDFWKIAEIIVEYHDYGKLHSPFQKKIIKRGNLLDPPYELYNVPEVPHNFLSPCFIPEEVLRNYSDDILKVIFQVITYHHERDIDKSIFELVVEVAEKDLARFKTPLFLKSWQYIDPQKYINVNDGSLFKLFILLKGLLHRLDYTASGDLEVELPSDDVDNKICLGLKYKGKKLNEMQEEVLKNSDKNILLIASTGLGKTEAGTLYINQEKGFFVLPLRASINAIYDRLTKIDAQKNLGYNLENVGLLHSASLYKYFEDMCNKDINFEKIDLENSCDFHKIFNSYQESKNLSYPFNIATPDQLFPFVFKFPGYERIYATLGYSKIVVDEIQMYDPKMLAYILKGLQTVTQLGSKIMVMTATFPAFLKKEFEKLEIKFDKILKFSDDKVRHNLRIEKEKDIFDLIEEIENKGKQLKVLVICNTVDKAITVYDALNIENKFLLHSRFLRKHRKELERKIQNFAMNSQERDNEPGIWVTTQIVEVSLDVDFDILFTELSSIDSLIQRMGRVNRSGRRKIDPNVIVCCKKRGDKKDNGCSGIGKIYDETIFDRTKLVLEDGNLMENQKFELVESVYDEKEIDKTKFYEKFQQAMKLINEIWEIGKIFNPIQSLKEAQKQFREIFTVTVIPLSIYNSNLEFFKKNKNILSFSNILDKMQAKKELLEFTVDVPWYIKDVKGSVIKNSKKNDIYNIYNIFLTDLKYDFDETTWKGKGLLLELDDDYNLID